MLMLASSCISILEHIKKNEFRITLTKLDTIVLKPHIHMICYEFAKAT
jgi:hypothetical protein